MSDLFRQEITLIGESKHILELLKINIPTPIEIGKGSPLWCITHLHFKATMRGAYPIRLFELSKKNPNVILAVTSGSTTGPTYRFLMHQGVHVPIEMSYIKTLQPHYDWAESLSIEEAKNRTKKFTPPDLEKVSKILDVAIEDPEIEYEIQDL